MQTDMTPIIFQTADPNEYHDMLFETSRTVREFCRRQKIKYESYVGIKRGYQNWHATYNRIVMFDEYIRRGFRGWAVYMDADAYVVDLNFDFLTYLCDKSEFAAIMIPSQATPNFWDVNAGVIVLNLERPSAHLIVQQWISQFMAVSDDVMRNSEPFGAENDQVLLHRILTENENLWPEVFLESPKLMNSQDASFIRQHLRAYTSDLLERTRSIKEAVNRVFSDCSSGGSFQSAVTSLGSSNQAGEWRSAITALYRGILDRAPDETGLQSYISVIERQGVEGGLETIVKWLLGSDEYKRIANGMVTK
jgi:hypothetical protein